MAEGQSDAKAAGSQFDTPITVHADNGCEGGDDRDGKHAKQIWNLQ